MKAHVKKTGDTVVVAFEGKIDFESHIPLRQDLGRLLKQTRQQLTDSTPKVVFNFEKLEFVGSSGISSFIQTLKDFNSVSPVRPRYSHVGSEFRRMIEAFDQEALFDFYDTEERAKTSQYDN